jgi:hypothetical protein
VPRGAPSRHDPQKKSLVARERCTAQVAARREAFVEQIQSSDPERLIFIDESGSHIAMTRTHAWAPRGERAHGIVPRNRGKGAAGLDALAYAGGVVGTEVVHDDNVAG